MLGAKDVAFPRLNLVSYYLYVIGAIYGIISIVQGGVDTGWTFYTPYSSDSTTAVIPMVTAAFILGFSSIFTGLNFIVTVHKLRPPSMDWFKLPLFIWATYATALIQIIATPVIGITLLLLMLEKAFHIGIFDPALGGDPVLFQHFFWFYSHPAVYIMILPAMGVISEIIATHSRKHIFSYKLIAFSSIAIAVFGFLVWGHHMFTSGQSPLVNMIFSALTYSVSIPSAVKVFNWLATMYRGNLQLNTAMYYGLSFLFLFAIGGLTGIPLASLSTDIHLHDTYFVVAHFHYVMMGSAMFGFIGGIHHWWPKMTGRMYNEVMGKWGCVLIFIGFNLAFLPQFVSGAHGQMRRYYNYPPEFHLNHVLSTAGAYIMLIGFVLIAITLLHSLYRGRKAPANPWGGNTLEWHCSSPPPHDNFASPPPVGDPYDYSNLVYSPEVGGYVERPAGQPKPAKVAH
jgi:cytochrome c oxidase subunit 1